MSQILPQILHHLRSLLRWYLAAFHAGRKSDVAKKPYNPILGEVFSCWWDSVGIKKPSRPSSAEEGGPPPPTPDSTPSSGTILGVPKFNRNLITDANRPFFSSDGVFLPWIKEGSRNTLTFFGEQVSHHPPVSAFYAEHPAKRISVNAHIWTKSKFLGLSVGVHNIGEATVSVINGVGGREEYVLGFPSGYARSVLSVPWVELGGVVGINCAQTGYRTEIEFCTKTMLGRDRNRVSCEDVSGVKTF